MDIGVTLEALELKSSKKSFWNSTLLGGTFLILLSALTAYLFPNGSFLSPPIQVSTNDKSSHIQLTAGGGEVSKIKTVEWGLLQALDYKNLKIPTELLKVINQRVRIPGFAVPLSDGLRNIREFLLVPNQMACIHVPAPPPNLVVLVELEEGVSIQELTGPIWIEGILELKESKSVYGSAAYEMKADTITPYSVPS
ncbi:MAG: DUF3299 domain-containing protein [Oligoflexales bacterium]|nr:DUF3299 domain-containing protein [Oligoflexales bacterium]